MSSKTKQTGLYLALLTLVATLGGLLFGYDTAVVNGAEKSLVDFFISNITTDHAYAVSMITQYKLLVSTVVILVLAILSSQIFKLVGTTKGGITVGILLQ